MHSTTTSWTLSALFLAALPWGCSDDNGRQSVNTSDCPTAGGEMARLPEGHCIDLTEVRREDYFAWLDQEPSVADQAAVCATNTDFTPACAITGSWAPGRNPDHPIRCVDWCDALAYCEAHGKHLCGAMGGGPADPDAYDDPGQDEWFAACSSGGVNDFTYGNEYIEHRCKESTEDSDFGTVEVASRTGCVSPTEGYRGIYDLSGNVAEWQNSCEGDEASDGCRLRGGGYNHWGIGLRCDAGRDLFMPRTHYERGIGFRCCAD